MRHLNEEDYKDLVDKGKVDFRETRLALIKDRAAGVDRDVDSDDHPLVEQSKAMIKVAASLEKSNMYLAIAVDKLVNMQKEQQGDALHGKKRKPWRLKINRNNFGFMESVDLIPVDEK